jgi:hypothetical protein
VQPFAADLDRVIAVISRSCLSPACATAVSSTFGRRKNGLPNLNVVSKPIAVSAGMFEGTAERGRSSRE